MPNAAQHRRLVEEVAAEFGATVNRSGSDHLRVQGIGWFVTLSSTPKGNWSKDRIRKSVEKQIYRLSCKRAERI